MGPKLTIIFSAFLFSSAVMGGRLDRVEKGIPLYKDPKASVEKRVEDLLRRMTLQEKIDLLGGTGFATKPIARLGIPELKMTDGPLGVRWEKSTAFPAGIALASTWDPSLVEQIGKAIGREVKSKGRHVILGPCVNIARIPQGGRNFESFGEDPFLTSSMTVPYIKGVQSENVAATVKHFACNNQEYERDFVDVKVDDRALNEIYLPAFKSAVKQADVLALMCSYNKLNGHHASENDFLLINKLKKQWGFNYLVMSDWGAVHSTIPVANGGLDLEMPDGKYLNQSTLLDAVKDGTVKEETINEKIRRILRVIFKLGLFENPGKEQPALLHSKENLKAAFEAERSAIVLLKNENNVLPLNINKIKSIAVIGPNAAVLRTGGGGSSKVDPITAVSPLETLSKQINGKVKINYAEGLKLKGDATPIDSSLLFTDTTLNEHGLKGEYYANMNLEGSPTFTRIDPYVNFNWEDGSPQKDFPRDTFSVRWTGVLQVPKSGNYELQVSSDDGQRLYVDDKLVINDWKDHGFEDKTVKLELKAEKLYKLRYEFYENAGAAAARLAWNIPGEKLLAEAINAASISDIAIVFAGTTDRIETEGRDRDDLLLPDGQDKLINEIAKANKNTIVVLTTGSPVLMDNWISNVSGVLETWFGGEKMGDALSDVLLGKYSPSGKLPITFPHRWEDCSAYKTYKAESGTTNYSDGIYVGYRHFEKNNIKPLFSFGFGLSYSTFKYSDIMISPKASKNGKVNVTFTIQNTGNNEGEEVAQLYLRDVQSSIDKPLKELKGYKKVHLKAGEKKKVSITLNKDALSYYNTKNSSWTADPGEYEVLVGASSEDIRLTGKFNLE
ncbi:MAG: glycoside hydrolase family 3 C-terminal domain-containing protein [Bacteroidota bacterium]|nr:glycoside hydrolase family 3 C-terminal domain-containing protein [Bacteroidota bacterium]